MDGRTATRPLTTLETVCFVTPARWATSCIVTMSILILPIKYIRTVTLHGQGVKAGGHDLHAASRKGVEASSGKVLSLHVLFYRSKES
ncbi:hypothetical protein GCM10010433_63220 [Streptomyces pulveraceus]